MLVPKKHNRTKGGSLIFLHSHSLKAAVIESKRERVSVNTLYMLTLVFIANIPIKDHRKPHTSRLRKPVQDVFTGTDENQNAAESGGSAMGKNNNPSPPKIVLY